MSVKKFMSSSIILFLDSLVVAAGGWFFWVVVSKIATVSEVGQATTVFSLVSVVNALAQLGLEYPILRDSSIERDRILASGLILEILITLAIMPVMIFALVALYGGTFIWIAVLLLLFSSVGFISRFVLLGISRAKAIFIIDSIGTIVKFVVGYSLVSAGLGASGILISFLSLSIVVSSIALWLAKSVFEFKLGDIQFFRNFIVRGLVNTPAKLSGVLIFSLSVVLLAAFGTSPSDIAAFTSL